ncbi:hypothetical protein ACG95N_09525 [Acinetobacter guillouiae]|uniref:hypothetical protein n=1 Tax=Acinetobacter guillouiae TaxID=106649 RepID=UPI003AF81192
MSHLKKYIAIYSPLYVASTSIITSGSIILANGYVATSIIVAVAFAAHTIVGKGKDKLSEMDESSITGKLKKENLDLKSKLSEKEAMLISLRTTLINHAAQDNGKKTKKDMSQLVSGLLLWCAETDGMNTMNDVKQEDMSNQRTNIQSFLESKNRHFY